MSETPKHTSLPWRYQEESDAYTHIIRGPKDQYVAGLSQDSSGHAEADARLIVQAVNSLPRHLAALDKINAIRNSIVGFQCVGFSEHVYPLVAALEEAGFQGEGYEEAREKIAAYVKRRDETAALLGEAERVLEGLIEQRKIGNGHIPEEVFIKAESELSRLRAAREVKA